MCDCPCGADIPNTGCHPEATLAPYLMAPVCPWDLYARQLFPLGYGHPLWHPEPDGGREVMLGDVGWFENGAFYPLFNSLHSTADALNEANGTPADFAPLRNVKVATLSKINQNFLFSRSVRGVRISGSASMNL